MRPRTRPDQSATEYRFTRNEVLYECTTESSPVHAGEKVWFATVEANSYECFSYTGDEFNRKEDRVAFENEIIDAVLRRTHELESFSDPALQLLRMSELRPGRLLERRDGQEGRVAEVDARGRRILFETQRGSAVPLVWANIEDLQLSRSNPLFVRPRNFQLVQEKSD